MQAIAAPELANTKLALLHGAQMRVTEIPKEPSALQHGSHWGRGCVTPGLWAAHPCGGVWCLMQSIRKWRWEWANLVSVSSFPSVSWRGISLFWSFPVQVLPPHFHFLNEILIFYDWALLFNTKPHIKKKKWRNVFKAFFLSKRTSTELHTCPW